jgi:hypothetical protein
MYREDSKCTYRFKKLYFFTYYIIYKWYERGPSVWMSDWKASLTMDALVLFGLFPFVIYYKMFMNRHFEIGDNGTMVVFFVLCVSVPNYFVFHYKNQWKSIVVYFDKLPKKKNVFGGWIVFGFILTIVLNCINAFYHLSLVDWSMYRY